MPCVWLCYWHLLTEFWGRTETGQVSVVIVPLGCLSGHMQGSCLQSGAHCVIASGSLLSGESPESYSISSHQSGSFCRCPTSASDQVTSPAPHLARDRLSLHFVHALISMFSKYGENWGSVFLSCRYWEKCNYYFFFWKKHKMLFLMCSCPTTGRDFTVFTLVVMP